MIFHCAMTTMVAIIVAAIAAVAALDSFLLVESFEMETTLISTRATPRFDKTVETEGVLRPIPTHCRRDVTTLHVVNNCNNYDMICSDDEGHINVESRGDDQQPFQESRRSMLKKGVQVALGLQLSTVLTGNSMVSTAAASSDTVTINVNPIAHTFVVSGSSKPKPKPIRENDATRILTNARVVILFASGDGKTQSLANDVVELITKRKEECGPGVTPGSIVRFPATKSTNLVDAIVKSSSSPDTTGAVLMFGPIPSQGIVNDGRLKDEIASKLGTFVGSSKSGGIVSVLLDGPTQNVVLSDSGYTISDLLWYSLPIS